MICGKCHNQVPDNFAFCPYCGQKIEAPAPAEPAPAAPASSSEVLQAPVIARSAMPKEEEYAGRYETGDMPEPAIRFSKNLAFKQPAPAAPVVEQSTEPVKEEVPAEPKCAACGAPLREGAKFCNICGQAVTRAEEPPKVEEPVVPELPMEEAPAEPKCAACGAPLREGAKFCNICGQAVTKAEEPPKVEEPVVPELPMEEEPAEPKCAACGAPLKEGAKFCNICGQAVTKAEEPPKVEESVVPELPMEEEPAEPKCAACGAPLKEGAKFCNICGQAVVKAEEPVAPEIPSTQQKPVQKPAAPVQRPALKKCPLCGTVVSADAKSCTGCGVAFRVQEAAQQQPAAGKKCPVCGSGVAENARFCNVCGTTMAAAPQTAAPAKQKKAKAPKKSKAALVIAIVVLALIGIAVTGFMTNWFGLAGGPMETIYNAMDKTLHSGGFHVDFNISMNRAVDVNGSADCVIDIEAKELTALVEARAMGQTIQIAIMGNEAVMKDPEGNVQKMMLGSAVDMVFESLEEDMTMDEALELLVETALETSGLEDMVDSDKAIECVDKSLNSSSWMKKNAGYSTESKGGVTKHVFQPKLGELAIAAVEALKPAFEDADELEDGLEELKDMESEMNDMAEIELEFGVKGGNLVSIDADVSADGQHIIAEITFEDIGSAKVDTDEIEDLFDAAE